jgi:hypothetical protein
VKTDCSVDCMPMARKRKHKSNWRGEDAMRDRHASGTEKWHRNKKLSEALELSWASLCFAAGLHRKKKSGEDFCACRLNAFVGVASPREWRRLDCVRSDGEFHGGHSDERDCLWEASQLI